MELYAVKYGESLFPLKSIYQDMNMSSDKVEFLWLFYIAKLDDKIILFDTGFRDEYMIKKWGVSFTDYQPELSQIVNSNHDVDVVFITHSHFDHIGNLDLYDNALTIISKKELETAKESGERAIRKRLSMDNIIAVDDEFMYKDTFLFKEVGGHSLGSSVIYFTNNSIPYVITGDECYVCDNMLLTRPVGIYKNIDRNMQFLKSGKEQGMIPLPLHDVRVFTNYKAISKNIVQII